MLNSLDLFIILFGVVLFSSIVLILLMFLFKKPKVKNILFYLVSILTLYIAYGGIRMGIVGSLSTQLILGILVAILAITSIVLRLVFKNNKVLLPTQILTACTLLFGMLNAFII